MEKIIIIGIMLIIFCSFAQATLIYYNDGLNESQITINTSTIPTYIPSIIFIKGFYKDHCGWCFFSGKIILSVDCNFNFWMKHESRHAYQFTIARKEAVAICTNNNLSWNTDCWEKYANGMIV